MIKIPSFLKKQMQSDSYSNKSNPDYKNANKEVSKYLNIFYPGKMEFDSTGKMREPEFDMTLEQFENAQNQIDADFEETKDEAEDEITDEFGEYFKNLGIDFDIEEYVIIDETIPVKVLNSNGEIEIKYLEFYDLEIPDFQKTNIIWVWHCEHSESTCDECSELDGKIFFEESELPECPVHKNCSCWIEESEIDEDGNKIKSKKYEIPKTNLSGEEKMNQKEMKLSEKGLELLRKKEKTVIVGGRHVLYDDSNRKPLLSEKPLPKGATIGYGHLVKPGENFYNGLTEKQATELFKQDIKGIENAVRNNIDVPLTQNQFDALVLLTYNIGPAGLKNSTVRQFINYPDFISNKYPTLEMAWKAWTKDDGKFIKGLANRRNYEWNLYKNGIYD